MFNTGAVFLFFPRLSSSSHLTSSYLTFTGSTSTTISPPPVRTGILQSLSWPLIATPPTKRILPRPEHSMPFLMHFLHVGSPLSQTILRREHWKHPVRHVLVQPIVPKKILK